MKGIGHILAADITVSVRWESTQAVERSRHTMRSPNWRTVCMSHAAGRKTTNLKIGCVRNRNSRGTTRKVRGIDRNPRRIEWRRSNKG
jgi:hypothetical protein